MSAEDPDIGWYYYITPSDSIDAAARILRALHCCFTHEQWVGALRDSKKIHAGEIGRAGGIIFIHQARVPCFVGAPAAAFP